MQRLDAPAIDSIKAASRFGARRSEACCLEHSEVLRYRWPGDLQAFGEFSDRKGASAQAREDRASSRIAERVEYAICISHSLRKLQLTTDPVKFYQISEETGFPSGFKNLCPGFHG
jgi:hypothetical protein